MVEYYNGRARDVHGEPIGVEHRGSGFRGVAIDPHSPPQYESEGAYLARFQLLTAKERPRRPTLPSCLPRARSNTRSTRASQSRTFS